MGRNRAYVVRDRGSVNRVRFVLFGLLVLAWAVLPWFGLAAALQTSDSPVELVVGIGLIALPGMMMLVGGVGRFPDRWWGPVLLAVDARGVRLPDRVPWPEIVGIGIGPRVEGDGPGIEADSPTHLIAEFERHVHDGPPITAVAAEPAAVEQVLVTVAVIAHAPSRTGAFVTGVRSVERFRGAARERREFAVADELDALLDVLHRWQHSWSARQQPIGTSCYVDRDLLDIDEFDRAIRRNRSGLAAGPFPALRPGAFDTPHNAAALLAHLAGQYDSLHQPD